MFLQRWAFQPDPCAECRTCRSHRESLPYYLLVAFALAAKPSRKRFNSAVKVVSSADERDSTTGRNRVVLTSWALLMTASPREVRLARSCRRSSWSTEDLTRPSRSRAVIKPETVARVTPIAATMSLCGTPFPPAAH